MKGNELCSYLQDNLFPSLGVPLAPGQEYVRALQHLDLKKFKKFFVVIFIIHIRREFNILDIRKQVILEAFQEAFG